MSVPIRPLILAVLLSTAAGSVLAQSAPAPDSRRLGSSGGAAATLPNTFDAPATPPPATPASPAPGSAGQVTEADIAEGALRAVIADLANGRIDTDLFTEDLAGRLRPQLATFKTVIEGFGALGGITPQGVNNGANQFEVAFENALTQWVIGLDEDGRIAALLFRPAPAESSEPEAVP